MLAFKGAGISFISLKIYFMINNLQIIRKKRAPQSLNKNEFLTLVKYNGPCMAEPVTIIEKVLIARVISGDSSAFSVIFTTYYKDLVLFAGRIIKDPANAEEIVQEVFVNIWEDRDRLNISSSLKSYLLKTVRNRCIDWLRHDKIIRKHNEFVSERPMDLDYDTDSYLLFSELQERLDAVLERLPDEVTEAFRMNRERGLKYYEIAELLNVSVRTIEVRIGKALHILRYHLREYFPVVILAMFSYLF
jgi:RNA polymerase sigma-70 factor, ECF subfamily